MIHLRLPGFSVASVMDEWSDDHSDVRAALDSAVIVPQACPWWKTVGCLGSIATCTAVCAYNAPAPWVYAICRETCLQASGASDCASCL